MEKLMEDDLLEMGDNPIIDLSGIYELATRLLNIVFGKGNYSFPIDLE